jgi:hypothetical protein
VTAKTDAGLIYFQNTVYSLFGHQNRSVCTYMVDYSIDSEFACSLCHELFVGRRTCVLFFVNTFISFDPRES